MNEGTNRIRTVLHVSATPEMRGKAEADLRVPDPGERLGSDDGHPEAPEKTDEEDGPSLGDGRADH